MYLVYPLDDPFLIMTNHTADSYSEENLTWLVSEVGQEWLDRVQDLRKENPDILALLGILRKQLAPEKGSLLLHQLELRERAKGKFPFSDSMLFSPTLFEQSTDFSLACYKAVRFRPYQRIADLCSGLGGDLLGLAASLADREFYVYDRSPIALALTKANIGLLPENRHQFSFHQQILDKNFLDLSSCDCWHFDPDRRAQGQRTTQWEAMEPSPECGRLYLELCENSAWKLAPATEMPPDWELICEREWIGHHRECKQQVAWFGGMTDSAGLRRATVIDGEGKPLGSFLGDPDPPLQLGSLAAYLYEPDPTLLAAGIIGDFAEKLEVAGLIPRGGYLTGDRLLDHPMLQTFRILEILPYQVKNLRRHLRQRDVGHLEMKCRGIKVDLEGLRKQLRLEGSLTQTLILTRFRERRVAILAERIEA
ncbi:Hypothetical protein PBC10988_7510 [Planctomycetales bacterium 10988]|nr:Hypothetical protein PBC10988_7510 [Planctomycetales bacterium 10988]